MPEIPDLSKFAKDGEPKDGKVHLSDEEREALLAMAKAEDKDVPETPKATEVVTAFSVVLTTDGSIRVVAYEGDSFILQRPAGTVDILSAGAYIAADVQVALTAQRTVQLMMQTSAQAAEAQANARLQQQIQQGGRNGLGFPPGR